jgi:tetratricopeptide (TPR) repeat protein
VRLFVGGVSVVLGGAGSLLGPAWAAAGVIAGPFVAVAALAVVQVLTTPDPADLLRAGRHREALPLLEEQMPYWRQLARKWPGQFRGTLAQQLMTRATALSAAHRDGEALAAAEQAVALYRDLAAARPRRPASQSDLASALNNLSYPLRVAGRRDEALAAAEEALRIYRPLAASRPREYRYRLANSLGTQAELLSQAGRDREALAATSEAARIFQDIPHADPAASQAAGLLFLHGQLLCDLSRHREAARSLARAWALAAPQDGQEPGNPSFDKTVLKNAYQADPAGFSGTWRTETGAVPPLWLTGHDALPADRETALPGRLRQAPPGWR